MYIARDSNGYIYFYTKKPSKREDLGVWLIEDECDSRATLLINVVLPKSINPSWDDPEPMEVKLVRKNK